MYRPSFKGRIARGRDSGSYQNKKITSDEHKNQLKNSDSERNRDIERGGWCINDNAYSQISIIPVNVLDLYIVCDTPVVLIRVHNT